MTLCLQISENILCELYIFASHSILAKSLDTENLETCGSEVGFGISKAKARLTQAQCLCQGILGRYANAIVPAS